MLCLRSLLGQRCSHSELIMLLKRHRVKIRAIKGFLLWCNTSTKTSIKLVLVTGHNTYAPISQYSDDIVFLSNLVLSLLFKHCDCWLKSHLDRTHPWECKEQLCGLDFDFLPYFTVVPYITEIKWTENGCHAIVFLVFSANPYLTILLFCGECYWNWFHQLKWLYNTLLHTSNL